MHDSDNDPNKKGADNLDGFEDDFEFDDEEFEFEEDWENEENPDKDQKQSGDFVSETQAPLTSPEPPELSITDDTDTNPDSAQIPPEETKEKEQPPLQSAPPNPEPLETPPKSKVKKKKRPLFKYTAGLLAIGAVSATAYNTLHQSLTPTLMPIIKLATPSNQEKNDDFVIDAQKRINEIKNKERATKKNAEEEKKRQAKEALMMPFEEESDLSNQNIIQPNTHNVDAIQENLSVLGEKKKSVLTPLPVNLGENYVELPSLENALEQISLNDASITYNAGITQDIEQIEANTETKAEDMPNPFLSDQISNDSALETNMPDNTLDLRNEPDENTLKKPVIKNSFDMDNLSAIEDEYLSKTEELPEEATIVTEIETSDAENVADIVLNEQKVIEIEAEKTATNIEEIEETAIKDISAKKPETLKNAPLWQLRAVRPGRAVLYDENTGDIEAVEVGDNIRGLGRIKTIAQKHGQWLIIGDEGIVTQ